MIAFGIDKPNEPSALYALVHLFTQPPSPSTWRKLSYDFGMGGVVSLFFYGLLVALPEAQRRRRMRNVLRAQYRATKRSLLATILGVTDGSYSYELLDELSDQERFRVHFSEAVAEGQDRWHSFANKLTADTVNEILLTLEIFREDIRYVLGKADIADDHAHDFLLRFSRTIQSYHGTTTDYDESKVFLRFLWSLLSGFSASTGYSERDPISDMIGKI